MKGSIAALAVSALVAALPAQAVDLGGLLGNDRLGTLGKNLLEGGNRQGALSGISNQDQIGALKEALSQGAGSAVSSLSRVNGFLGNDRVRIPLPGRLQQLDDLLGQVGLGKYGDDLRTSINRAAEAAVPEAKTLLIGAIRDMSVADAKGILTGRNDAATRYFRSKTETSIAAKFRPVVAKAMSRVQLSRTYDRFAAKGEKFGLVSAQDASLEEYITRKAMDGLFLMMADEEKAIRADPLKASGDLAKKVFSALGR